MGYFLARALCCMLVLTAGVIGMPQFGFDEAEITIQPTDPCIAFLNMEMPRGRHGEREEGELNSPGSLEVLALACLSRVKRATATPIYMNEESSSKPRDARGLLFKTQNDRGRLIYPGTKWCGPGDIARGFWDLGQLSNEDRCCREHDYCPEQITAGQCSHGLCNTAPFTRSHCACDEHFRHCLQALKSPAADTIGALYFNVGSTVCFAEADGYSDFFPEEGNVDLVDSRLRSGMKTLKLWPKNLADSSEVLGPRRIIGCSKRPNCQYSYHAQQPYTEAASINSKISNTGQLSRSYHQETRHSQLQNVVMDKRGALSSRTNGARANDIDYQAAEIFSKFFHHLLRSAGILRPSHSNRFST